MNRAQPIPVGGLTVEPLFHAERFRPHAWRVVTSRGVMLWRFEDAVPDRALRWAREWLGGQR